jgi:hypothetical protein
VWSTRLGVGHIGGISGSRFCLFQLSAEEYANLKSQFVTSSWGGARRAAPYAFTKPGVATLSSVLRSRRAIQMNIGIMRAFVKFREALATHQDLARRKPREPEETRDSTKLPRYQERRNPPSWPPGSDERNEAEWS